MRFVHVPVMLCYNGVCHSGDLVVEKGDLMSCCSSYRKSQTHQALLVKTRVIKIQKVGGGF